jgi:Fe-S-cluster containining protein
MMEERMVERPLPSYREIRQQAGEECDCRTCGACCDLAEGMFECLPGDVYRWLEQKRSDILRYVRYRLHENGDLAFLHSEIWVDPQSAGTELMVRCPFLTCTWQEGFGCAIYETRPFICKDFEAGGERCLTARRKVFRKPGMRPSVPL